MCSHLSEIVNLLFGTLESAPKDSGIHHTHCAGLECYDTFHLSEPLGLDSISVQLWTLGLRTSTLTLKASIYRDTLDMLLLSKFYALTAIQKDLVYLAKKAGLTANQLVAKNLLPGLDSNLTIQAKAAASAGIDTLIVSISDDSGHSATSRTAFQVAAAKDTLGPTIKWTSPTSSISVDASVSTYKVQVVATDPSGVDSVYLQNAKAAHDSGSYWSSTVPLGQPNGQALNIVAKAWDKNRNVTLDSNVSGISAGWMFSLRAKSSNSTLWGTGDDQYGQLGNGSYSNVYTPIQIGLGPILSMATGWSHSLVVTSDGSLYVMGDNSFGEIGCGSSASVASPTKIMSGVAQVFGGAGQSFVLKTDGTLWVTGRSTSGELGIGSLTTLYAFQRLNF